MREKRGLLRSLALPVVFEQPTQEKPTKVNEATGLNWINPDHD
jgi:hypothetical protein